MSERQSDRDASPGARRARRTPDESTRAAHADESASPDAGASARSRRDFLRLLAVGSLAAVTGAAAVPRRTRAADAPAKRPAAPPPAAVRKEIQSQKDYLARALKTIREYPLETGSPMAFEFRPLRAARGTRKEKKS